VVSFVADGQAFSAPEGRSVLRACREHGIAIPTLCHREGLSPAGTCRLCLVEVAGLPRPVPACATTIWEGMEIVTHSDAIQQRRRAVVEMLFAGGDHVCAFCPSSGCCELQDLARALGLDHVTLGVQRRAVPVDASHPTFGMDVGRCVLCSRCVRVCAEVERAGTLGIAGRGRDARVVTDAAQWGASRTCTACGKCVAACPTGALFEKTLGAQGLLPQLEPRGTHAEAERHSPGRARFPISSMPVARSDGPRARLATLQLGGCAGCHMSLLDGDERVLALARYADLVYSPFADASAFPEQVDVCLVEGAVATARDLALLRRARERTRWLVALGDCAGWGNVTAMRDAIGGAARVMAAAWGSASRDPALPALLDRVLPLEEVVAVDLHLPGCPPTADLILFATSELLAERVPQLAGAGRFG
jgi:bidirectional [NiFe] hydrogenase diaphorase subunit